MYLRPSHGPEVGCPRAKLGNTGQNTGSESEPPAQDHGDIWSISSVSPMGKEAAAHGARGRSPQAPSSTLPLTYEGPSLPPTPGPREHAHEQQDRLLLHRPRKHPTRGLLHLNSAPPLCFQDAPLPLLRKGRLSATPLRHPSCESYPGQEVV